MYAQARQAGFRVTSSTRGFVFNADLASVVRFLDIGTRVDFTRTSPGDAWQAAATTVGSGLRHRDFRVSRQGFGPSECLDAAAGNAERDRFAIADGGSEGGPDSGRWARLLVDDFVETQITQEPWPASLPALQARWQVEAGQGVVLTDIPWYVEEHARAR